MPPKRTRVVKPATSSEGNALAPAPSAVPAPPRRTDANAHLYNEDMYGLNPQLDQRTRAIISCYVLDNIPPSIVRAAFAKAHIYPLSAVLAVKKHESCRDGGQVARKSARTLKETAAQSFVDLGKKAELMSDTEVIAEAAAILAKVTQSDTYAMRSLEEVADGTRKRKPKQVTAPAPAHKRTLGLFTPQDSAAIQDSFVAADAFHQATHLFECNALLPGYGCQKRYGAWHFLKAHLSSEHNCDASELSPKQEVWRKDMAEMQKRARSNPAAAADIVAAATAAGADIAPSAKVDIAHNDDVNDTFKCILLYDDAEGERQHCGFTGCHDDMTQHYWDLHPRWFCQGRAQNLNTGEIFGDENLEPLDIETGRFLKAALTGPGYPSMFQVQAVLQWLQEYGPLDIQNFDSLLAAYSSPAGAAPTSQPPATKSKTKTKRKCLTCGQPMLGHKRNACRPPSLSLSPSKSPNNSSFQTPQRKSQRSHTSSNASTPVTQPHSPSSP
jgi:hypothetical protein